MAEDIERLIRWAQLQGFRVEVTEKGYRHFYTRDGMWIVFYPATPGRSRRRYTDVLCALRQYGLVWPPPSTKEQRSQRRKESP